MSDPVLSVACPCGSVMTNGDLAELVNELHSHAKNNHSADLG